jgi:hypothetical protein
MKRYEIINRIIQNKGYHNYLEIGVRDGECFKAINIAGTIIIDEKIFPFNINDLIIKFGNNNRNGWYLQQLLKLYAGNVIPGILKNYLIIDSDTYFLKPTAFINHNNKYMYTTGIEYHIPYFNHMNKLHPLLKKSHSYSGISHHMIFNRQIIKEMFNLVEDFHKKEFWVIFIEMVDEHTKHHINAAESGASEYELYFNYMNQYHRDKILVRNLLWANKQHNYDINTPCNLDYISICSWSK